MKIEILRDVLVRRLSLPLNDDLIMEIYKKCLIKNHYLKQGDCIWEENAFVNRIKILLNGEVKMYCSDEATKTPVCVGRLLAPYVFCPSALFSEAPYAPASFIADSEVFVLSLSLKKDEQIDKNSQFHKSLFALSQRAERLLLQRLYVLSLPHTRQKVAVSLLRLKKKQELRNRVLLDHSSLSEELVINRSTLYRVLENFEEEGLIFYQGKKLRIMDENRLKQIAQGN